MLTQFPDVNVTAIYKFVETGLDRSHFRATTSRQEDADEAAERAFQRNVGDKIPDFAALLEAVAPTLRRFVYMSDSVHEYIAKQRKQISYLNSIIVMTYLFIIFIMLYFVFVMWRKSEKNNDLLYGITRVSVLVIAFLFMHSIVFTMKTMLSTRKDAIDQIDTTVLDKYKENLGKNVFVKFAEAYSKGPSEGKKFITDHAQVVLSEEQEETEDIVFDFCSQRDEPGAVPTRECIIDPCPPKDLQGVLLQHVKNTWERRNDSAPDCDKVMLALLQSLSEIHTGNIFESNDSFAMWRGIQNGIDDLRLFVYRRLDVDSSQTISHKRDTALKVVRDKVIPALVLPAMESSDLKPENIDNMDGSVASKEECWRLALENPDCVWAYYHPCKGALFAATDCEDVRGCVSLSDRVKSRLTFTDPSEIDGNNTQQQGTLLIKRGYKNGGEQGHRMYVKGTRPSVESSLPPTWVAKERRSASSFSDLETISIADPQSPIVAESVDIDAQGNHTYNSYLTSEDDFVYADAFTSSSPHESMNVFVKTSIYGMYDVNAKNHTYSSFYALMPHITKDVVEILKPHHHAVSLESYREYIYTELEKQYGSTRFEALRPLLEEVLRKVRNTMDGIRSAVSDRTTYISMTRFEEKLKGLTYSETKRLVEKLGTLSKMTKLYVTKFPIKESDRSLYRVGMLWATAAVLILLFALVLYNLISISSADKIDTSVIFRNVAMSICMFVFSLVVFGSMMARYISTKRFNEQISDDNSKRMVTSVVRAMDLAAQHLEFLAHQRRVAMKNAMNNRIVKKEFVDLYRKIGHVGRARALERGLQEDDGSCLSMAESGGMCGPVHNMKCPEGQCCSSDGKCIDCDESTSQDGLMEGEEYHNRASSIETEEASNFRKSLADEPPNYSELFLNFRTSIDTYDHCNNITVPSRPPFPTFEIVIYTIIAFITLAMLFYSYAKIDPLGTVKNINVLNDARANIKSGYPSPADMNNLAKCRSATQDVWSLVYNITVIIMVVFIFMIIYFIVHSSSNYENSLYMSALYGEGRCKKQ